MLHNLVIGALLGLASRGRLRDWACSASNAFLSWKHEDLRPCQKIECREKEEETHIGSIIRLDSLTSNESPRIDNSSFVITSRFCNHFQA